MKDEYISADKLYKILRYSKRKTKYLLDNGIIPCEISDKTTWRYKIKMSDVQAYLENSMQYFIPVGIFSSDSRIQVLKNNLTDEEYMRLYRIIKRGLSKVPDALTIDETAAASGYSRTFILKIIHSGDLHAEKILCHYIIPKEKLVCFLAGRNGLAVTYKSEFHKKLIQIFIESQ